MPPLNIDEISTLAIQLYLDTSSVSVSSIKEHLAELIKDKNIDRNDIHAECFMKKGEQSDKWISALISVGINSISTHLSRCDTKELLTVKVTEDANLSSFEKMIFVCSSESFTFLTNQYLVQAGITVFKVCPLKTNEAKLAKK
ncbi:hypothetical protein [Photobacterium kishitanii]|uniref:Uncharacterized protein n=1 Tax=Photobacterium kishitanii TaxID=318456 RepID=A0A2T3KMJ6_9GAMM|nr:hypothetical protein [Photobacterium kishitanii]PSV01004.1 hypothetical protein C9J27_02970 [Photobacterium kishitanii]